jgi:N-acetyl-anhydromuramyl-L-alanine amidase AmpD
VLHLDRTAALERIVGGVMAVFPTGSWRPGPKSKQGYDGLAVNAVKGVICHSMVGSFAGAMSRLDSADRASWHFSVCKDGRVFQHYDTLAVTWHAGSRIWNSKLIGIEHEGGAPGNEGEPLTDAQKAASVALVRWLAKTHGFPLVRFNGLSGALFEHRDVYATSCPSGRIPWAAYVEGRMKWTDEKLDEALTNILGTLGGKADDAKVKEAVTNILGTLSGKADKADVDALEGRVSVLEQPLH